MDILNQTFAGLISLLIVMLGGYDGSQDIAANASQPAVVEESRDHEGIINSVRDSLIRLESRIREGGEVSDDRGADETAESDSSEHLGNDDSDSTTIGTDDDSDDNHGGAGDENEDDEDEDGGGRGRTGSGSTGAAPAAPPPATQTSFTLSEVAAHNTSASCYSAINGSVYDLTQWISQHPGGQAAIKSLCGVDGSSAFNGQHGGSSKPSTMLAGFRIGPLK